MSTKNQTRVNTEHKIMIDRIFNASREDVFNAWIDEKKISKWFSPKDFTVSYCVLNPIPSGEFLLTMRGPDGKEYPSRGYFVEVVDNEKLVFNSALLDEKGISLIEDYTTVTFQDAGKGKTKVSVNAQVIKVSAGAEQFLDGMDEGWNQTIDKLGEFLNEKNF